MQVPSVTMVQTQEERWQEKLRNSLETRLENKQLRISSRCQPLAKT